MSNKRKKKSVAFETPADAISWYGKFKDMERTDVPPPLPWVSKGLQEKQRRERVKKASQKKQRL